MTYVENREEDGIEYSGILRSRSHRRGNLLDSGSAGNHPSYMIIPHISKIWHNKHRGRGIGGRTERRLKQWFDSCEP
jgi:hypothetical protein